MKIKEIINRILYYVSVPKCVSCNEVLDYEDKGLCKSCLEIYKEHKTRNCPRCAQVLCQCSCTYDYLDAHGIKRMVKLFRYSKSEQSAPSNYLIYSLKQDNRDDVVSFLSNELSEAIKFSINLTEHEYVITNVPRRKRAMVKFGFDHAKVLAKSVAKILGIEYVDVLKSKSKKAQKSVYGHARKENARFDYKCNPDFSLKGKSVILVDDIITTGSSLASCSTLLKGLGTKSISGAVLGTAYREEYIDYKHSAF